MLLSRREPSVHRELVEHLDPVDVDELLRLYDTEIAATDRALGRLFDRVLQESYRVLLADVLAATKRGRAL